MNQEATAYLNEALDYIEHNSVMSARVDWPTLRQEMSALVALAQSPAETYPAITHTLEILGDHHSHFRRPANVQLLSKGQAKQFGLRITHPDGIIGLVYPNSPAAQAGLQTGDHIETINGQLITHLSNWQLRSLLILNDQHDDLTLTLKSAEQPLIRSIHLQAASYDTTRIPQGRPLEHALGYLDLPGLTGNQQQAGTYAQTVQQLLREIDETSPQAWILDLRRNTGGNMWPMIAGIGPLLDIEEWIVFVNQLEQQSAFYRNGQAGISPNFVFTTVDNPYQLKHPAPPVAVLTSQLTSSSGEFVALAFRGRPQTRSFGEPTQGVPTANEHTTLPDGALIVLTTALGADRHGHTYDSPLLPDYPVKIDWTQLGTTNDPVLQAAVQWLLHATSTGL